MGSYLRVRYANGDDVAVRFREWPSVAALVTEFEDVARFQTRLPFPLVTVEVTLAVGGTTISFGPRATRLPGLVLTGNFTSHGANGFVFG